MMHDSKYAVRLPIGQKKEVLAPVLTDLQRLVPSQLNEAIVV
jgi:hypothetical protein